MDDEFQAAFNKSVLGIFKQGCKSYNDGVGCQYRMECQGTILKCGVGQLIDDDTYPWVQEGCTPAELSNKVIAKIMNIDPKDTGKSSVASAFLSHLQSCHDNAASGPNFIAEFSERIAVMASEWHLKIPTCGDLITEFNAPNEQV